MHRNQPAMPTERFLQQALSERRAVDPRPSFSDPGISADFSGLFTAGGI